MSRSPYDLQDLSRNQLERLAYIDFRLYFLGQLRRLDLQDRFGIAPAAATRDIALYKEVAPSNIVFEGSDKSYGASDTFVPKFEHHPLRVLTMLSQGFGDGVGDALGSMVPCDLPAPLSLPKVPILAAVTRGINLAQPLRVTYCSHSSGATTRDIVPLALVNSGVRWHVRVFDRKSQQFRDFVLTRITNVYPLPDNTVLAHERLSHDLQWSRVIELKLVPHPRNSRVELAQLDYQLDEGVLTVRVRASNAGYILRHWSVDCSPDHSLQGREYVLWLPDSLALYGAESAVVAPGYVRPALDNGLPVFRAAPSTHESGDPPR
jgi:predicted DNA-binding transcriptional regulator YafY